MAAFLALPLLIPQRRGKSGGVCVALSLILFLQKARISAGDTIGECRVEVLRGKNSVSVPLKDGKAVLLSPKYTEPLLKDIKFWQGEREFTCNDKNQWNRQEKKINCACSWWQKVDLTVDNDDGDDDDDDMNDCIHKCSARTSIGHGNVNELMIHNTGEDTRLVAVNCDEIACPIIDSTSMNEIRKHYLPDKLVYARKKTQDAVAVLTNYSTCSVSNNNKTISCENCGTTDIWKSEAEESSWVKLANEGNTCSNTEQTMIMLQVVYSSDMEWALGCDPDETDSAEGTTIQDSLMPTTPLYPKQYYEVTARTQNTNEGSVITDANDICMAYVWMTLIALLNTLLLLVLLSHIAHHMISQEQKEMNEEEKTTGKRMKLKRIMDGVVAFWHSSHPSQVATNTENHHSHHSIQLPEKVENNSQKHAQLPPYLEPNTSNERHKRDSIPAPRPLTPPPCPATDKLNYQNPLDSQEEEPEYDYIDLPIMPVPPQQQQLLKDNQEALKKVEGSSLNQTQPCPYSESKSTTERQKGSLMKVPPPPSLIPPPCPGTENLNSQESSDTTEEEHEYDYIAMPVMPMPPQQQQPKDNQQTKEGESKTHIQPCPNSESKTNTERQKDYQMPQSHPPVHQFAQAEREKFPSFLSCPSHLQQKQKDKQENVSTHEK